MAYAKLYFLLPVRFCGHRAFTVCPLLWTPCFYCLSTFVDTALLLPVRFCGHRAFTVCPLLWTPRFYRLSTFVDIAPLLPVHFCGHFPFTTTQIPIYWNLQWRDFVRERLTFAKYHCFHTQFFYPPAKRNSIIPEFL